jgi:hypothetical protein
MELKMTLDAKKWSSYPQISGKKISAYTYLPVVDYDKTYYFLDEQKKRIVACKIESIFVGAVAGFTDLLGVYFRLRTPAGIYQQIIDDARLFETSEDCLQYTIGKAQPCKFKSVSFKDLFPEHIIQYSRTLFNPTPKKCFAFVNGKVTKVYANILHVVFDKNGCNVCVAERNDRGHKVYLNLETCVMEQVDGLQIVDFAEEEKPVQSTTDPETSKPQTPKVHTLHFVEL